jgi:hypothetical protein
MSREWLQLLGQELDQRRFTCTRSVRGTMQAGWEEYAPAPFAPTTAIRESNPISMFTFFRRILSRVYPNVTSFNCRRGGDILSVSGNLSIRETNSRGSKVERGILEALRVLRFGRFQIGKFLQDFDSCLCLCGYNRASARDTAWE